MFIDWAEKLELLQHNPASYILKDFSLPVKKILVQQVVTFLLEPGVSTKVLTSPAHVSWALETCGQGFTLPIEEEDSITKVILLYKIWALESKTRPQPINENTQYFLQEILKHSSLLFEPRANIKDVERHAQLCSTVLDIYASIGRTLGNSLSVETWEIFLKLLISITDSILRHDVVNESIKGLQKKLCPQLLKVLFELWLLSRTRNPALWYALKQRVRGWTHHISLILTWRETCFALTRRSTSILYGPSEGTDTVIIKIQDTVQTIALEDEYVFYSWHRMLNIIGNPNESINLPNNFLEFMKGVEMLVNQYLRIGTNIPASLSGTGTINLASTTLPSIKTIGNVNQQDNTINNARFMPPNGNTILHIFGTWFFDAIHLDRTGFDEGTSLAIKTLATTITTKHKTDFLPIYSSSFYSCMQQALSKEGRVLITTIQSSFNLFTYELKGLRCLIPFYVSAIKKVLTGKAKLNDQVSPSENVRKSCLQILSTILSLPYQFTKTIFATTLLEIPTSNSAGSNLNNAGNSSTSSSTRNYSGPANYNELIPIFSDILLEAMKLETHFQNIEYLLNLVYVWQLETISDSSNFTKQSIKLITRKICNDSQWSPDVIIRSLKMLASMSNLYSKISPGDLVASQLISALCKYISSVPIANYTPIQEQIISLSFKCISSWLMVPDQWIFRETPELRLSLLSAIVIGVGLKYADPTTEEMQNNKKKIKKKDQEKQKDIDKTLSTSHEQSPEDLSLVKVSAKETLHVLLNHLGNFPPSSGASAISSLALEEEVLLDIILRSDEEAPITVEKSKEFMRYYITDDRVIICVIDRPNFDNSDKVCIIVRNESGRYAWDTNLSYLPLFNNSNELGSSPTNSPIQSHTIEPIQVSSTPHQASSEPISVQSIGNVLSYLETIKSHNNYFKNVDEQVHKEFKLLQKTQFKLNNDVSIKAPKPADPYIGDCKFQQSRIFLSHLGFLSLENRDKLYPLHMNQSFFQSLKQLDQQAERICLRVGVVYVQQTQDEDEEWYSNEGGSMDYQEFIATLGWGVNLSKHKGYYGTLDVSGSNLFGSVAPYWANYSTEILFQVCTLMPNNPNYPDHAQKRKQALNGYCTVVWTEDLANFNPQSVWKRLRHNSFFIVVVPHDCKLYYVRLFTKNNDTSQLSPIVDGMIVSKKILSQLVRDTVIMAYDIENPNAKTPHQTRQDCIEKIYKDCKRTCNLEQFYTLQFTELPPDQCGPSFTLPKARKRSDKVKRTESSKDAKQQQWVGTRGAPRGGFVGNTHRQKGLSASINENDSESPETQKFHDSKEKKLRKKEKSKKKDRPRSRIKEGTISGEKKDESESETQE